jgi:hypothetical protein
MEFFRLEQPAGKVIASSLLGLQGAEAFNRLERTFPQVGKTANPAFSCCDT